MTDRKKITCWATGDRCHGCPHYWGNAEHCSSRPKKRPERVVYWLTGRCSFCSIFGEST